MKKKCKELVFTIDEHSMALAFRSGTPSKGRPALFGQNSVGQPQSAKEALDNLKRAARGLKASTYGLALELTALSQAAKINGGKFPDVNAIAQQVLDGNIHSHHMGGGTGEGEEADPANQGSLS